jgi:hypothetical protein
VPRWSRPFETGGSGVAAVHCEGGRGSTVPAIGRFGHPWTVGSEHCWTLGSDLAGPWGNSRRGSPVGDLTSNACHQLQETVSFGRRPRPKIVSTPSITSERALRSHGGGLSPGSYGSRRCGLTPARVTKGVPRASMDNRLAHGLFPICAPSSRRALPAGAGRPHPRGLGRRYAKSLSCTRTGGRRRRRISAL